MRRSTFKRLVREAVAELPAEFLNRLENVEITVERRPSPQDLRTMGRSPGEALFGLYVGIPLKDRGSWYGSVLPDRIVIYQEPLEAYCRDRAELIAQVRQTVRHEIGHHFGLNEAELRTIEQRR